MKIIFLITLTLGLVTTGPTPHEFEDGFVERTLAIVIRDDVATAEYSIALNETTLQNLLDRWQKTEASNPPASAQPESAKTPGPTKTDAQSKALIEPSSHRQAPNPHSEPPSADQSRAELRSTKPENSAATTAQPQRRGVGQWGEPTLDSEVSPLDDQGTSNNTATGGVNEPDAKHVEIPIPEDLLESLRKLGPSQITRQIRITCNGQPLQIKNVSADAAPRHPFNLVVQFEFQIPADAIPDKTAPDDDSVKSAQLKIEDQNFRQQTGAIRYALKTLGSTMLLKSDAAPILVRAQRHELAGLSKKETAIQTSISAEILFTSNLKLGD